MLNPGIETYRPLGTPASGYITVVKKPSTTPNVVIGGVTFTYGTHFSGDTASEIADFLTSAINSDRRLGYDHVATAQVVVRPYWAMYIGNRVYVIATVPGTAGNSITLASTDSESFSISGATFSGGLNDGLMGLMATLSGSTLSTATTGTYIKTVSSSSIPEALGSSGTVFRRVAFGGYKAARTANTGTVWIQYASTDGAAGLPLLSTGWVTYEAPIGVTYNAAQFYIDVETNNDGVVALYTV